MEAIELISQDLFDKVRSRFQNLEMGDEDGNITLDPRRARFFDFDFVLEGHNLGRVSISVNERGSLKVFYSQGILEGVDTISQEMWYNFLREMRIFAKRRLLRFDTRDITKSNLDKNDFQYLATTGTKEDTMQESKMFGSSKSSYLPLEKTRLIIRHSKAVDEMQRGSRSRNINSIFVENALGERFKYPFIHLAGAKAMQRHVANGGRPHDDCGMAIIKMSEQIAQLNAFKRHVGNHDSMQTEANEIMERACAKLEALRHQVECLSKQGHYEMWKESFTPVSEDGTIDQATMENYKNTFTVNTFNENLAEYFPLIHSIMQETSEVSLDEYVKEGSKEETCEGCDHPVDKCTCDDKKKNEGFAAFEDWATRVEEGRLGMDQVGELSDLLKQDLTLGTDAVSAIEALQGIGIHNDELENDLKKIASVDPESDPKPIIISWLTKYDPQAASDLGVIKDKSSEPAADQAPAEPGAESPQKETDQEMIDEKEKPSLLDIAERVKSFYDRETGTFPLGETGVATKVRKEMGDWAGDLAERLCMSLKDNSPREDHETMHNDDDCTVTIHVHDDHAFEDILYLSGIKKG